MSLILSLAWAQSGLIAPFTGFLSDRIGTRVLILVGALLIPLLSISTALVGWRISIFLAGIVIGIIVIPVSLVIRSRPEDLGIRPYGSKDLRDTVSPVMSCGVASVVDLQLRKAYPREHFGVL